MKWSLHQLAPICIVPHCPRYGTRHLLTHQEEIASQILNGSENYIYWQGGVGSAKTLCYGVIAAALTIMLPGSRGILFRKDFGLNHETLWGYYLRSIEAAFLQGILPSRKSLTPEESFRKCLSVKKEGGHTILTLPDDRVWRAGQTKSWSQFMGPTYDVIVVSDAMENNNFGEIFHGEGVVGGLQSRLRGQVSSFYRLPSGEVKDMRRFLIETNPPPNVNELHEIFGREPGVRNLTKVSDPVTGRYITYRHIQSTSVQNDHNPPSYVAEIASQHNSADIRRILQGQTLAYYGGVKVIETFYPEIHVGSISVDPDLSLLVGLDDGYQHPSAIISQIKRCAYGKEHFISLSEVTNLYNKTTQQFIELNEGSDIGLLAHLGLFYPDHFDYERYLQLRERELDSVQGDKSRLNSRHLEEHFFHFRFCIGREANKRSAQTEEAKTNRLILLNEYGISCQYRNNIFLGPSLQRVREEFKLPEGLCQCGIPRVLLNKDCSLLIDAYSGGYRFPKKKDGTHGDKPIEDHVYEDPADAHRYSLENFYFAQPLVVEKPQKPQPQPDRYPWSWLERS